MPDADDLVAEVGRISVVVRYIPAQTFLGNRETPFESEEAFDEYALSTLSDQAGFLRSAMQDALAPDFVVTRLTVQPTSSIEVVAVIGVAYKLLKDFNEVADTLRTAREHLTNLVQSILYSHTPMLWGTFVASGLLTTASPQFQFDSTASTMSVHQVPPAPSASMRQISALRTPIHWDLDAFLTRLVVPLAFLAGVVGLAIGLIAAIRLI
jgi:hypothetical protein